MTDRDSGPGPLDHDIGLEARAYAKVLEQLHSAIAGTPEEARVLQMIRSAEYEHVEVTSPDGKIEQIRITLRPDVASSIGTLLQQHAFQSLNVNVKHGKIANIVQEVTIKPQRGTDA